jgi:hypothetical protein
VADILDDHEGELSDTLSDLSKIGDIVKEAAITPKPVSV